MKSSTSFILIGLALVLASCGAALKTQSSGKAGTPYVEFFMQPGVTQYYVGPLKFKAESKESIEIDFTLRDSTETVSPVAMNFTLFAERMWPTPDSLVFHDLGLRAIVVVAPFDRFFVEKADVIKHRYGTFIPYPQLKRIFASEELSVSYWSNGERMDCGIVKKSRKIMKSVNDGMIDQIEFTKQLK